MMSAWPSVLDEYETIAQLDDGMSLARYGDGECKLMRGAAQVREPANPALAAELQHVIRATDSPCLVGIPRLYEGGAKQQNWLTRAPSFLPFLDPQRTYASAFISRPDSAEHIRTLGYAQEVARLWHGKRVALVSERHVAIFRLLQRSIPTRADGKMLHIPCPHRETYQQLDALEAQVLRAHPDIALLSCGPAATCLAFRLALRGLQAIDLGSAGGFLLQLLYGVPEPPREKDRG